MQNKRNIGLASSTRKIASDFSSHSSVFIFLIIIFHGCSGELKNPGLFKTLTSQPDNSTKSYQQEPNEYKNSESNLSDKVGYQNQNFYGPVDNKVQKTYDEMERRNNNSLELSPLHSLQLGNWKTLLDKSSKNNSDKNNITNSLLYAPPNTMPFLNALEASKFESEQLNLTSSTYFDHLYELWTNMSQDNEKHINESEFDKTLNNSNGQFNPGLNEHKQSKIKR